MSSKKDLSNLSESQKSKIKQSKLAIIAGSTIIAGILLLIVLLFVQNDQSKKTSQEQNIAIDELQGDIDTIDKSTVELRSQLETMLSQLDSMGVLIDENKATVERINTTASTSGENIERVEKEALALQSSLSEYIKTFEKETSSTNQAVENSFNEVYADIQDMLTVINNNNGQQNSNYSSISSQVTKTLNDTEKAIKELSKANEEQSEALSKQMSDFNDGLKKLIEDNFADVNEKLDNAKDQVDSAKEDITALINEVAESEEVDENGQVKGINPNINAKYELVKEQLKGVDKAFNDAVKSLNDAIEELKTQGADNHTATLEALEGVSTDLANAQKANKDSISEFSKAFNDAFGDLSTQLSDIAEDMNTNFGTMDTTLANVNSNVTTNIAGLKESVSSNLENQNTYINEQLNGLSSTMNGKFEELATNNANNIAGLKSTIDQYYAQVSQSFQSVADGKRLVASALATKNVQVSDTASFDELYDAILQVETQVVAGDASATGVVYTYHHHTLGENADSQARHGEYANNYISAEPAGCFTTPVFHTHSGSALNGTGCYSAPVYHEHSGSSVTGGGCYGTKVVTESGVSYALSCGKEAGVSVDYYTIGCGKDENTVDGFKRSCGLLEGQIVGEDVSFVNY